jgi:hypothetical protein
MVERETRRECLGGFYQWCEFHGEPSGGLNRPGGRERGWPEGGRCGCPATCNGSMPGAVALGACWRARLSTVRQVMRVLACWTGPR